MIDIHRQAFIEEASELLSELEKSLLELETVPNDKEIIAKVFRALHTIKGSSGMFGYDDIAMFTHDIESVYDLIRNEEMFVNKRIIDLTLKAIDQISVMLISVDNKNEIDTTITTEILSAFREILNSHKNKKNEEIEIVLSPKLDEEVKVAKKLKLYYIYFKPEKEILQNGTNPLSLISELNELGDVIPFCTFEDSLNMENISAESCYAEWKILLFTSKGYDSVKDVFIFVEDSAIITIEDLEKVTSLVNPQKRQEFINCFEHNVVQPNFNISTFVNNFEHNFYSGKTSTITKQKSVIEKHHEAEKVQSIRVSSDKLDELVNLVGELVTLQARLTQLAAKSNDSNIVSVSEEVERITWSLRDSALNIRMLTIGTTFSKFNRLVRDLSTELKKEVNLNIEGADTELDKTVIEKLNDPLVHIIRNSIDHGIEEPEIREKIGKPKVGEILLSASQSGGNVLIKISDDGAGLDQEAIRKKAIQNGVINEGAELTESELYALIFAPGFSTAKQVTNVSGRGVGMDVVKKAIESLRGSIDVVSKKSVGTTITLKLPLTLAIIDGLLVQVADNNYVLPLSSVEECIELMQQDIDDAHGRHFVNIRGEIVPYLNLRERFDFTGERPEIEQVVIASFNNMRVGFVVDKVIGQHQTVLKNLGKVYKNVEGVSGATILGDGTVALILDIAKLVETEVLLSKEL